MKFYDALVVADYFMRVLCALKIGKKRLACVDLVSKYGRKSGYL